MGLIKTRSGIQINLDLYIDETLIPACRNEVVQRVYKAASAVENGKDEGIEDCVKRKERLKSALCQHMFGETGTEFQRDGKQALMESIQSSSALVADQKRAPVPCGAAGLDNNS